MFAFFTAGQGAVLCLTNALFAKLYMTVFWRFKIALSKDKKTLKDIRDSSAFKSASSYQLNEAEWAPLFVSALLFAHSHDMQVDQAATLAVVGSLWFFWGGVMFGFPFHVPGATMRYAALALLAHALFQKLM
eukprot:CAMPEP_0114436036 /NCGR_PEP_ID=MMETSP0103-20121206/13202_1 /TAXON_ID=37642 ORGANISM="Paraphysomonas imperforata, Strain PA2" /NCGR_SAMPLE_ID=MMETSP0103 /ASSEMBLY_ACC=CAM_ASM_000201 /LENGTH=131 /DNA_ID=CAMNT_0001606207 /DNA_START=55 /DNA_END=450 /DNA_ORIENTATION=-